MKYVWMVALLIVGAGLMGPRLESCGPFFQDLLFTTDHHAQAVAVEAGRVGVLRAQFYRADLMMAYRTLSGVKLGAGEVPQPLNEVTPADDRVKPWTEARAAFGEPPKLDPDKK